MPETKNPFIAGNWVRGNSFFGRSRLINDILHGDRDFIWVAGTRRFGKTSLLKQLEWLTSAPDDSFGYISLFWDLQGSRNLDGLRESLLESIEDAEERFERIDVQVDDLESLDLFETLRQLRRKAKAHQLRLLLLCDEVEELINVEKNNPEALPKLRRILQRGTDVRAVLTATKRLERLESKTMLNTSPFLHGFVPPIYLRPLQTADSRLLLEAGRFEESEVAEIIGKTNNHPYLTQLIARRFFETGRLGDVIEEVAMDDMIGNFFAIDFKYLDDFQKELLLHILNNERQTLVRLQHKFDGRSEPLVKELYELNQLGFIHQQDNQYHISNHFFKQWLLREKDRLFSDSAIKRASVMPTPVSSSGPVGLLPQVGDILAQHEIVERVGSGGMGVVYKARDIQLERYTALKVLTPELVQDSEFRERFMAEARAASAMNHPNIATIYQIGVKENLHFLAMEFVDGQSLKDWRAEPGVDLQAQLTVARQVAEAIAHAHEKGVVHRDIKSDNVLVTEHRQAKVMDFGLAKTLKRVDGNLTKTGTTLGTLAYMSPEQASGLELDHLTDIFSFGVVLYELFTGALPFTGDYELSVMYAILNEEPAALRHLNPDVPARLEATVLKALAKNKSDRFQRAAEIYDALHI